MYPENSEIIPRSNPIYYTVVFEFSYIFTPATSFLENKSEIPKSWLDDCRHTWSADRFLDRFCILQYDHEAIKECILQENALLYNAFVPLLSLGGNHAFTRSCASFKITRNCSKVSYLKARFRSLYDGRKRLYPLSLLLPSLWMSSRPRLQPIV